MKKAALFATDMTGGSLERYSLFEGRVLGDELVVRALRPGDRVKGSFDAAGFDRSLPKMTVLLSGFPAALARSEPQRAYREWKPIVFDLRITVNRETVYDAPLFVRPHPLCDPLQQTALTLSWPKALRAGRNEIVIENRTKRGEIDGEDTLCLEAIFIHGATGKLVNAVHEPDALDLWLDGQKLDELKSGIGYELVPNRDIPAMIDACAEDRIGNYIIFRLDNALNDGCLATKAEFLDWARRCVERKIYFSFMIFRAKGYALDTKTVRQIEKLAGEYFVSLNFHELGLMAFGRADWIAPYLKKPITTVEEGIATYRAAMRTKIEKEMPHTSRPIMASELGTVNWLNLTSGVSNPIAELYPAHCMPIIAETRGAARTFRRHPWGIHSALLWGTFGFEPLFGWDQARVRRFDLTNKLSYLAGARILYPESGLFNVMASHVIGRTKAQLAAARHTPDDPIQQEMRSCMRRVRRLHAIHRLPADPRSDVAFMIGRLDPFHGRPGGRAFGHENLVDPQSLEGWDLLDTVFPNAYIGGPANAGRQTRRWFSGSPHGQPDIIHWTTPLAGLKRYKFVVMPGWNAMTPELYDRLTEYVRGGGMLLMSAPQLRTDDVYTPTTTFTLGTTGKPALALPKLFNGGDAARLFGVKLLSVGPTLAEADVHLPGQPPDRVRLFERNAIYSDLRTWDVPLAHAVKLQGARPLMTDVESDAPILVENRLGRGRAWLMTTWQYPGNPLFLPLWRRAFERTLGLVPRRVEVFGDKELQHFEFATGASDTVALIDTDWMNTDVRKPFALRIGRRWAVLQTLPGQVRIACHRSGLFVSPHSEECGVRILSHGAKRSVVQLTGFGPQQLDIICAGRTLAEVEGSSSTRPRISQFAPGTAHLRLSLQGPGRWRLGWR